MFIVLCIAFVILALILKSYPDVIFNFLIELSSNYYISEIIGTYFRIWFLINSFENEKKLKKSEVLSPTFNIVFEYKIKEFTIKHFDLYRLKNDNDVKNIGLYENLEQSITLIEWPELIKNKPENRLDLFFEYKEDYNERSLIIKTNGRLKIHEF